MGLIEDDEVVGKENARVAAGSPLGVEQSKEEAMVEDDDIGLADATAGRLVGAAIGGAVAAVANRGVGIDGGPKIVGRRGMGKILKQAGRCFLAPGGQLFEDLFVGPAKQVGFFVDGF